MKKYILTLILPAIVFAQTYMAKVEPYEEFTIYSQTSGQVVKLDKADETKIVSKVLIKLDDTLEKSKLNIYENQLSLYRKKLSLLEQNYKNFIKISGKSKSDKDTKYYEILELKISIESLKLSISELKDTINKKSVSVNNLYIKEFKIDKGDYVSTGSELATAYDTTKSKLIVYVSSDDYKDIESKEVLINSKKGLANIEKIDRTVDETYVSAYKVTLTIDDKDFGKIVKVEFVK